MPANYEDNFGFYSIEDDSDELAFFCYIKLKSMPKLCARCSQRVYLQPHKKMCATCLEAIEYGAPFDPDSE
jgi:predicted amidophosphoribosyltransferase